MRVNRLHPPPPPPPNDVVVGADRTRHHLRRRPRRLILLLLPRIRRPCPLLPHRAASSSSSLGSGGPAPSRRVTHRAASSSSRGSGGPAPSRRVAHRASSSSSSVSGGPAPSHHVAHRAAHRYASYSAPKVLLYEEKEFLISNLVRSVKTQMVRWMALMVTRTRCSTQCRTETANPLSRSAHKADGSHGGARQYFPTPTPVYSVGFDGATSLSGFKSWLQQNLYPVPEKQLLTLSMSPDVQSESGVNVAVAAPPPTESRKRPLAKCNLEAVHRKSIESFGQRTSQYRGVTRHR